MSTRSQQIELVLAVDRAESAVTEAMTNGNEHEIKNSKQEAMLDAATMELARSQSEVADVAGDSRELVSSASTVEVTASARAITLNLITGGFGIGMFSLPWSAAGASLINALLMVVLVTALNGCTVAVLVDGAEKYQAFDLGDLLRHLGGRFGRIIQIVVSIAVWVVLYLTQIGYIIVMLEAIKAMLGYGDDGEGGPDRSLLVFAISAAMIPISCLNQKYLGFTSQLAVLVNIYIVSVATAQPKQPSGLCIFGAGRGIISMLSVMSQAIVIQMCVLPMYKELEGRSPRKFKRIVFVAFSALIVVFSVIVVVGYWTYGGKVAGNILKSLPTNAWGNGARIAAGLSVGCVYPIFQQAMVAPCLTLPARYRRWGWMAALCATILLIALGSLVLRELEFINVVNGAFACIIFSGICPGLVGLFLLDKRSFVWRLAMVSLIVIATCLGVLGMSFTDNFSEELSENCLWKIT